MKRQYLYYIAAAIWGIPGFIISIKGFYAYSQMRSENLWWLLLITAVMSGHCPEVCLRYSDGVYRLIL